MTRGWSGDLSDLRIYNRLFSGAEVQVLANAPSVNAGSNQTIIWPAAANLAGTVTDDGKPNPPGTVTTIWSQIGGPGAVTFGSSNALATPASFSVAGTYQLQLAANDGQATTVGSIMVNAVKPALSLSLFSNALQLSWPTNSTNWLLQYQTNPPSVGLGTNWMGVPGLITNPFAMPIRPDVGSAFYRLVLTNQ